MYNDDQLLYETQQSERMLLGMLLSTKENYYDLRSKIDGDMFTDSDAAAVFSGIVKAEQDNVDVDMVSVSERCRGIDPSMLFTWATQFVGLEVSTESVIESLRKTVKRRKLIEFLQSVNSVLADKALNSQLIDSYVNNAYEKFVKEAGTSNDTEHISVSADQIYDEYANNADLGIDSLSGLATGFSAVDEVIGGMQEGNLIVIGGATSIGKTAFALNIAQNVAEQGKNVFIVSLEMNSKENTKRFISSYSGIPANKVTLPSVWEAYGKGESVGQVFETVSKLPIRYLCTGDSVSITLNRIRTTAMAMKARRGLDLIVVDYLQLLESDERSQGDTERISKISRGLKNLAVNLNVPVIALAQFNREAGKGMRPKMAYFKGSSSIEQDANIGILLHRNKGNTQDECGGDYFDPELTNGETRVYIEKNRNGMQRDDIKLKFNKVTTQFYE